MLEEGDLKLERETSQKELLATKEEKYEYDMKSNVFKIKIPQRVKEQMDSFEFNVYIKCNTDELSISDKNRLYYLQYKDDKYGSDFSNSDFHSIEEDNRYWIGIKVKK
jgi:hypothetical protein